MKAGRRTAARRGADVQTAGEQPGGRGVSCKKRTKFAQKLFKTELKFTLSKHKILFFDKNITEKICKMMSEHVQNLRGAAPLRRSSEGTGSHE